MSKKSSILNVTLEVINGPATGTKKNLQKDLILIGRSEECDFMISDLSVSRKHFELIVGTHQVIARNINGRNPILLNKQKVVESVLKPNDVVTAGDSDIKIIFSPPEIKNLSLPNVSNDNTQDFDKKNVKNDVAHFESKGIQDLAPTIKQNIPQNNNNIPLKGADKNQPSHLKKPTGAGVDYNKLKEAQKPPSYQYSDQLNQKKSPLMFFILLIILGFFVYEMFFSEDSKVKKKNSVQLRENIIALQNIRKSEENIENINKENEKQKTIFYQKSQEQYLKGFRDYRNGNYLRAMEYFAAALSFYPEHEAAKRYYFLAKRKNEEFAQYHFNLGKKYYGIKNYRLCSAHFAIFLKIKKEEKDSLRQEAIQLMKECDLQKESRY